MHEKDEQPDNKPLQPYEQLVDSLPASNASQFSPGHTPPRERHHAYTCLWFFLLFVGAGLLTGTIIIDQGCKAIFGRQLPPPQAHPPQTNP